MALTATSTKKVKGDIMEHLQLMEVNTDVIFKSPDRPNIFLEIVKKESTEYETCLSWLIEHIRVKGSNSKKTIIYCRSIDAVSEMFCTLKDCLGKMAYVDGKIDSQQDSKDRSINEFKKGDSHIRCIVATVTLGMGLDIRDVDLVMHIGCPKTLVSYWQDSGRCARDGRAGYSLVLYDKFTLSLKTTEKEVAQLILNKDEKCIRQEILKFLTDDEIVAEVKPSEKCNGSCDLQCQCNMCKCCSICRKKCPRQENLKFDIHEFLKL
jgi:superfamily II DNA helicase RecQ